MDVFALGARPHGAVRVGIDLSILYRGPLSSCNYDCWYCPFGKHHENAKELQNDREKLARFVEWVVHRPADDQIAVFFTPWGEALTRRWYREAMIDLSHAAQVTKVAVQTNLACQLEWLKDCHLDRVGLWCTYHPSQTSLHEFIQQCRQLDQLHVSYSVGVVGLKENFGDIEALRCQLAPDIYLWVNAYKDKADYYSDQDVTLLEQIDPLFPLNNTRHPSLGRACRTGESVISVDGDGNVRRCHFIKTVLGNLYSDSLEQLLAPRLCTNQTCGCHIGYVHLEELQLDGVFGDGLLERVLGRIQHRHASKSALAALPLAETSAVPQFRQEDFRGDRRR